jgi:hypothetical protein
VLSEFTTDGAALTKAVSTTPPPPKERISTTRSSTPSTRRGPGARAYDGRSPLRRNGLRQLDVAGRSAQAAADSVVRSSRSAQLAPVQLRDAQGARPSHRRPLRRDGDPTGSSRSSRRSGSSSRTSTSSRIGRCSRRRSPRKVVVSVAGHAPARASYTTPAIDVAPQGRSRRAGSTRRSRHRG